MSRRGINSPRVTLNPCYEYGCLGRHRSLDTFISVLSAILTHQQFLYIPSSYQPCHTHVPRFAPRFLKEDYLIIPIDKIALVYTINPEVSPLVSDFASSGNDLLSVVRIGSCYTVHIDPSKQMPELFFAFTYAD